MTVPAHGSGPADGPGPADRTWRPVVLDAATGLPRGTTPPPSGGRLDPDVTVIDRRDAQRADLAELRSGVGHEDADAEGCWVYYPWRRTLIGVLGAPAFRALRLDRNRNKITSAEQDRLGRLRIGVVGLSVGHAVAHSLALEGLCGELRLADFDTIAVSNLNRVPATLFDVGLNKAVVAARRIAELDPFLALTVYPDGVDAENIARFLDGLDIVVEECDSLDLKVMIREEARRRCIPVLMETSDRGLLDVERFDLEPDRPLFHGALGDVDSASLRGLSTKDKVPHVLRILGASALSARLAASMVEIGRTVTTWPQLGGDVSLGAATIAAAVRRLGTGQPLASGRVRVDLEQPLALLADPADVPTPRTPDPAGRRPDRDDAPRIPSTAPRPDVVEPASPAASPPAPPPDDTVIAQVLAAIRRAPSGGNAQPWRVETGTDEVRLYLDRTRTTTMDVAFRGSHVALGAALFNARSAAAAADALGAVALFPEPDHADLVATVRLGHGSDEFAARFFGQVARRGTNRALGDPRPITAAVQRTLRATTAHEGGRLHLVEPGPELTVAADAMATADRVRFLSETLHREMFDELVWPDAAPSDTGIETATLATAEADLAKLTIARRPEVMALLAEWDAGAALGDDTRDRLASCSALAVVTVDGATPGDFVRGGSAVEATWLAAEQHGLAVHPMSPVFLFGVRPEDLTTLSAVFADELARSQATFRDAIGLDDNESVALVLRLSHTDVKPPRSRRRPLGAGRTTT